MRIFLLPALLTGSAVMCGSAFGSAVVDANGTFIGAYVGELSAMQRPVPGLPLRRSEIVTTTGYRVVIDLDSGAVRSVFDVHYQSIDCTGQGYVELRGPNEFGEAPFRGYVFGSGSGLTVDPAFIFYVAKDGQLDTSGAFAFASRRSLDGTCNVSGGVADAIMIEVLDNDPEVTGFDPGGLTPPFDVVLKADLFSDSFESAA